MSTRDALAHQHYVDATNSEHWPSCPDSFRAGWDAALANAPEVLAMREVLDEIRARITDPVLCDQIAVAIDNYDDATSGEKGT